MPTRDVAQLILEVDARIATAQRAVNQLAKAVNSDASNMEQSLGRVANAHAKLGKAINDNNGRMRSGFTQLSFQIGDVSQQMALGVSGARIFAQQSGQVIQALQVMGGEGNKFLQFLGGPWGIAISTAAVILAPLASKLFETGDEVDALVEKMRRQASEAQLQERANKIWEQSIDGVREAQKKLRDEIEKTLTSEETLRQQNLDSANSRLGQQRGFLETDQRKFAQGGGDARIAELEKHFADIYAVGATPSGDANAALDDELKKLKALRAEIKQIQADISASERTVRDSQLAIANASADASASASAALQAQESSLKDLVNAGVTAGKVTVDAAERARTALNAYFEAEQAAATQGVNFAKVGTSKKIEELSQGFARGKVDVKAYTGAITDATKALNAAAKAAADAKKSASGGTGELANFIMPVQGTVTSGFGARTPPTKGASSYHPAIDIAAPIGTPVKAAAGGVVIYTGRLGGLGNVVVVDHGGGTITEYGHLSKILTQKGANVDQGAVIAEVGSTGISTGPHLDYRVKVGGKYVDPRKGKFPVDSVAAGMKAGNAAESAEDKALRQQNAFEEQSDRLNQELIQAKTQLVQGIEAQADAAEEAVRAEQARRDAAVQNDVEEGKLTQAQANELKAKNESIAAEKIKAIEIGKQVDLIRQQSERDQRTFQYSIDDLRFADEMATTSAQHRKLQLQILDIVYQQKEAKLRALKAELEVAGKLEEAADVQAEIDRLPTDKAHDQARARNATKSPYDEFRDSLPHDLDDVKARLEQINIAGLKGLNEDLANATAEMLGLKGAAADTFAQLVKLGLEFVEGQLLGQSQEAKDAKLAAAGGSLTAAGTTLSAAGATLTTSAGLWQAVAVQLETSAIALSAAAAANGVAGAASGASGLFGFLGGGAGAASGADLLYDPSLLGLATGGFVSGPGNSTSDSIPAMLSNGEYVMNAAAVRKFGVQYLDMMNGGRLPHMKHGGLLGSLLPFVFGGLGGLLFGGNPLLMAGISGGLFNLGKKADGPFGDVLKFLGSPALFLGSELYDHRKDILKYLTPGSVLWSHTNGPPSLPSVPSINPSRAANSNVRQEGDTHIHVTAPNTGDPVKDRQTSLQQAADVDAVVSGKRRKGTI